jgi:hypothetical protein
LKIVANDIFSGIGQVTNSAFSINGCGMFQTLQNNLQKNGAMVKKNYCKLHKITLAS